MGESAADNYQTEGIRTKLVSYHWGTLKPNLNSCFIPTKLCKVPGIKLFKIVLYNHYYISLKGLLKLCLKNRGI